VCGDGFVQVDVEACDLGDGNGPGQACNDFCELNVCGDLDVGPGEECDDGNMMGGDGCTAACKLEACGNSVVDPGEQCDDGKNGNQDDGCTDTCKLPACGDSIVQNSIGEQCDLGPANNNTGTCTLACKNAVVRRRPHPGQRRAVRQRRDERQRQGVQGQLHPADLRRRVRRPRRGLRRRQPEQRRHLHQRVQAATCGDGFVQPGEACDLGMNNSNTGLCTLACKAPACGDGFTQPSNNESATTPTWLNVDACTNACKPPRAATASSRRANEQCDDGNQVNTDACTRLCKSAACGDGIVQPGNGETCDDGNQNPERRLRRLRQLVQAGQRPAVVLQPGRLRPGVQRRVRRLRQGPRRQPDDVDPGPGHRARVPEPRDRVRDPRGQHEQLHVRVPRGLPAATTRTDVPRAAAVLDLQRLPEQAPQQHGPARRRLLAAGEPPLDLPVPVTD
jgi:cysteine-rich repeat protein